MSEQTDSAQAAPDRGASGDRDDTLARLLHLAGPRAAIPRELEQRVEARVRRQWQHATRRRRVIRWTVPLALAASVLMAVAVNRYTPPVPVAAAVIGTVARVVTGLDAGIPAVGTDVRRGETLATNAGESISIDLKSGASLRLAPVSELRLDGANEFALLEGELYADTGDGIYRSADLTVRTPLATVTDIGTQFAVRYSDDALRVAVREGRVDVAASDETHTAVAGDLLQLRPGGAADTQSIAAHDDFWDWATAVAPAFDIENRSLMEFLTWAARETGRELLFADDEQQIAVMRAVLHGSIDDFTPDQAIDSVLATSGFDYRLTAEQIYIGARRSD